jgi:hypothetical protein
LYRLSCTKLGQWAIGYVTADHKILQTIPQSLVQALIDGQKQGLYLYPDGKDVKVDISAAIAVTMASRIQISKEQFDMYCDIGSSFQTCKICSENNKDRKLEPCGHLICSTCLENWQELHSVASCPFCRCEIKAFEPIIISPFENDDQNNQQQKESDNVKNVKKKSRQNSSNESINTNHSSSSIPPSSNNFLSSINKKTHDHLLQNSNNQKSLTDEVIQQGQLEASNSVLFGARSRSSDTALTTSSASSTSCCSSDANRMHKNSKNVSPQSLPISESPLIDLNNIENRFENDFHISSNDEGKKIEQTFNLI